MTFDVTKSRADVLATLNNRELRDDRCTSIVAEHYDAACGEVERLTKELEASRKVTAFDFDVKAAREELARIDVAWDIGTEPEAQDAHAAARALLDRALAAIEAGWHEPAGDVVERATEAAFRASDGVRVGRPLDRQQWAVVARAVLRSAGRLREPVAITDAVVEEAAKRAWYSPDGDGHTPQSGTWESAGTTARDTKRHEARAVLEYGASIGGVTPASPRDVAPLPVLGNHYSHVPSVAPIDTGAAERLTRYRCAIVTGMLAGKLPHTSDGIETNAHAMLAAERPVSRG